MYDFNSYMTVELLENESSARHGLKVVAGDDRVSTLYWVTEPMMSLHVDMGGNLWYTSTRGWQGYAPRGAFRNIVNGDAGHA